MMKDRMNSSDSVPYIRYDYIIVLQQLELLKKSALWWKLNVSQLMTKLSARIEILKTPFLQIYVCWMLGHVNC